MRPELSPEHTAAKAAISERRSVATLANCVRKFVDASAHTVVVGVL
jgi:hypothetical protein